MANQPDTNDTMFDADVIRSEIPVSVVFWAPWCGPYRNLSPILEDLAVEYEGRMKFLRINTDDNPGIVSRFGIRSIPMLLVFKQGTLAAQIVGFRPKFDLRKRFDTILATDPS